MKLPPITDDERETLHDAADMDAVLEWVRGYGERCWLAALASPATSEGRGPELSEALETLAHTLAEVRHAQSTGKDWYTRGASGLYQQVAMWLRKGDEAIRTARAILATRATAPKEPENAAPAVAEGAPYAWPFPTNVARSWTGFNVVGDEASIKEVARLAHCEERLKWFEGEYARRAAEGLQANAAEPVK